MQWLTWDWFVCWVKTHPWLFITGIMFLLSAIGAAVTFSLNWPELWEKRRRRKEEKRIKHYVREIRETKRLIEEGKLKFETTQEALAHVQLLKKGDEELRNEAYRRIYPSKKH